MMVHACNSPALRRLMQENLEFKASLSYIARPCLNNNDDDNNNDNDNDKRKE
jgi:hypothetical protein